jgi:beta-glucosidase
MKKTKKNVFFAVAALMGFGLLSGELGTSVTGKTGLKGANTATSTGKKFYSAYASMEDVGEAGNKLTREIAGEGIIMLKNKDNVLPFKDVHNVTVFGKNSTATSIGGGGSGASKGYYPSAGIYDTLEEAGFNVNPAQKAFYLDDTRSGKARTAGGMMSSGGFTVGETPVANYESSVKETWSTYNDAAIITIVRSGSEGADEPVTGVVDHTGDTTTTDHHYLELSENEKDMIKMVKDSKKFSKIVVILNATNVMELGDLQDDDEIDAMLWTGGVGGTGFYAIGDILTGKVNPSGKTVDIYPRDLLKDPTSLNFGTNAQNQEGNASNYFLSPDKTDANYESKYKDVWYSKDKTGNYSTTETANIAAYTNYEEGVYLGYKYYETMYTVKGGIGNDTADNWYKENVVYPFGYGLSFTEFDVSQVTDSFNYNETTHDMTMKVTVKNTGSVAGKKTVQLYVEAPYIDGEIEKPSAVLVAFAKTGILQPGETEILELSWKDTDVASYDYNDANKNGFKGYELDKGSYKFKIAEDSHNYLDSYVWTLDAGKKLTTDGYTDNEVHNQFSSYIATSNTEDTNITNPYRSLPMDGDGLVVEQLSRATGKDLANINKPKAHGDAESTVKGDALALMSGIVTGVNLEGNDNINGYMPKTMKKTKADVEAEFGSDYTQGDTSVTEDFYSLAGVDPSTAEGKKLYNKVINKMSWEDLYKGLDDCGWHNAGISSINKPQTTDVDGPSAIYRVDYPVACTLAATFNVELAEKFGTLIGEESLWGIRPGWYGPAMDTHRSAFSGRNFEYYSEDGLLGGMMGAYSIKAAQAKGCYAFMKHMALNDCETQRNGNHAFVSEQAMREIYLKPFRLSVEIGDCKAVMAGMNSIGYIANYDNTAEMTYVLRDEWGFNGFTETDAGSFNYGTSPYSNGFMARVAGLDTLLGFGGKPSGLGTWDSTKKVPVEGSTELWTAYYYYRKSMINLLYVTANSSIAQNGVSFSKWDAENSTFNAPAGTSFTESLRATESVGTTDVWYEVTDGKLPEGISLDRYGNFTGSSTAKGTYTFTVTMHADGWITHSKKYTLNVIDAFKIDKTEITAGQAFEAQISSDYVKAEGKTTVTYMDNEGTLPEGLELSADGKITGTATKNGTYVFKLHVIQYTPGSGWYTPAVTNEYDQEITLTVKGGAEEHVVTADEAKEAADAAKTAADAAKTAADAAKTAADSAQTTADAAKKTAEEAKTAAESKTESKGCGGSVIAATSALGAMALMGVALAFKKKREEK